MTPLGILRKFIKGLSENTTPGQLAAGAALGVVIGLVPKANLTAQLLLILLMALRVNVPLALGVAALALMLTPLTDALAHPIGYALLVKAQFLAGFWTWLYNLPVAPWTAFNNTLVLGNLVLGALLFAPVFAAAKKMAIAYQSGYKEKLAASRFFRALRASWLVDWYFRFQ